MSDSPCVKDLTSDMEKVKNLYGCVINTMSSSICGVSRGTFFQGIE